MKDVNGEIQYRDKNYMLVFNLNVMQKIQEEYGTFAHWADLTDGSEKSGEPDARAVIFGFTEMINEGIDISNEENGTDEKPLTAKQIGRILTEVGLSNATALMSDTVIKSTESNEKNA